MQESREESGKESQIPPISAEIFPFESRSEIILKRFASNLRLPQQSLMYSYFLFFFFSSFLFFPLSFRFRHVALLFVCVAANVLSAAL